MPNDNQRNTVVFIVAAIAILIGYQFMVLGPATQKRQAEAAQLEAVAQAQQKANPGATTATGAPGAPSAAGPNAVVGRAMALARSPRVAIDNADLAGSIALKGARIDDLYLKKYRVTLDPKSPMVELLRPDGAEHAYFAEFGWVGANVPGLPRPDTVWTAAAGQRLTPKTPVVLTYANGAGLVFTRVVSIDDRYMFTISDTVANQGGAPVTLIPYGSVQRQGLPDDLGKNHIVHEGGIGVIPADGKQKLQLDKYGNWKKDPDESFKGKGGWVGITDKYWLAALIPAQGEDVTGNFRRTSAGAVDVFDANYVGAPKTIAPGAQITQTTRLFAGAKTVPVLRDYQKTLGIPRFDFAVDWGTFAGGLFSFFTRPIFNVLEFFFGGGTLLGWSFGGLGNFGLAILALTVVVKLLFFPLANKSYESLTKMKKVQPELARIKERSGGDAAKQQQEMMALYAKEKINPFMGCLPVLIQIPVFYSLYKVLTVTIEMRHAPFYGWVHDLSARDPTTIMNLFGLIPWDPASTPMIGFLLGTYLHLGIWPIIMGFTMWLQQAMSPPAGIDPIQQKIFQFFPIILTFTLTGVAAGLVIYWSWNNLLSILQQYVIMRRFKVDNPIDDIIAKLTGKAKPSASS